MTRRNLCLFAGLSTLLRSWVWLAPVPAHADVWDRDTVYAERVGALQAAIAAKPNDANALGNCMGGRVMHLIDIAAAIASFRHCRTQVVTASFDELSFLHPVRVGELVILRASVNFAGRSLATYADLILRISSIMMGITSKRSPTIP